jgi:hypothetical protein
MSDTGLNIVVVVPSGTHWLADFATSLISMMGYFMNTPVPGMKTHEFRVINIKGSILPTSRLNGLKAAKSLEATHLLYVDSDHTFPPDMLHKLLRWKKDCMTVNCTTKSIPSTTTARSFNPDNAQGNIVYSDENMKGTISRVWRIGTGVMLLSAKAYNQIPHNAFSMPYMPDADVYQGEDWSLCEALNTAGVPIYVDHGLSREVGHIGNFTYTHEFVGELYRSPEVQPI